MLVFGGVILLRANVRVKYSKVVLVTPSFCRKGRPAGLHRWEVHAGSCRQERLGVIFFRIPPLCQVSCLLRSSSHRMKANVMGREGGGEQQVFYLALPWSTRKGKANEQWSRLPPKEKLSGTHFCNVPLQWAKQGWDARENETIVSHCNVLRRRLLLLLLLLLLLVAE